MVKQAFALSEQHEVPVIVRMTTRVCHVKAMVTVAGQRTERRRRLPEESQRWVMTPANAKPRLPVMHQREQRLQALRQTSDLNLSVTGSDRRIGFVTAGPAFMHVRETSPNAPSSSSGFSCPPPLENPRLRRPGRYPQVVEETEPLLETEIRAAGLEVRGGYSAALGRIGAQRVAPGDQALLGEPYRFRTRPQSTVFPRLPTMCASCPHRPPTSPSHIRNLNIVGDIGCYTRCRSSLERAGYLHLHGRLLSMAHGMDKGRGVSDEKKSIVAVIGDSTFLHMGMQGLLNMIYNRGNVTVLLLDNRSVGMTGGQENPGTGQNLHGLPTPRVDFAKLAEALGVRPERASAWSIPTSCPPWSSWYGKKPR